MIRFMKRVCLKCMVVLFIVLQFTSAQAQDAKIVSMTKYLSNCLYNFSRNINWPEENKSGEFIITIVGNNELHAEMSKLTRNMMVGKQPIQVKYFKTVSEVYGYQHIIFVDNWQSSKINTLIQMTSGRNTLVVTESEGLISRGSMINFVAVNGVMQFEINRDNLRKNNLSVSSNLEKMAVSVN